MSTIMKLSETHTTTTHPTPRYHHIFDNISMRTHLILSALLRIALIAYGYIHDKYSEVPYTDIDYVVVMDGARHLLAGRSPFERHAYRYSPLLAFLQVPSIVLHSTAGKFIYATFDLLVAILIYALVRSELQRQCRKAVQSLLNRYGKVRSHLADADARNRPEKYARLAACMWLYNPLTAIISTRGNGDSFSSFFVILTLYLLTRSEGPSEQNEIKTKARIYWLVFAAGLMHGLAIHLRLYPILFSLAYYLSLSKHLTRSVHDCVWQILRPNMQQVLLVAGTLVGVFSVSGLCYHLYGWDYLYEAHLYHFVRRDARHNFSFYFLLQYLGSDAAGGLSPAVRCLVAAPQFFLLLYLSLSFGQFRQTLPFCVFALAFVLVTFNTVVTSQYFVWYLSVLPLCLNNLHGVKGRRLIVLVAIWLLGQAGWLLPAYLLEFRTYNTFYWLGFQSAIFFGINGVILVTLIRHYSFASFKVNYKKLF